MNTEKQDLLRLVLNLEMQTRHAHEILEKLLATTAINKPSVEYFQLRDRITNMDMLIQHIKAGIKK